MARGAGKPKTPFFIPRQIAEWKKHPDVDWLKEAGLFRYMQHLREHIDLGRCKAFIASMRARQQEDPQSKEIAGVVEGILVQYSPMYLYRYFGWDGQGATCWTTQSPYPRPDTTACTQGYQAKDDGKFDVYILTRNNPHLPDPWFGRIRGTLSQIFFRNDCNTVHPDQLALLIMAGRGEKINWGSLVDRNAVQQIRAHVRNESYESPIAPFLTQYIG